jgi:ubiquitin-conjugating enzyme E2 S
VIAKQLAELQSKAPDGVTPHMNEANILDVQADIIGPIGTPYQGGLFRVKLVIEGDFPNNPPKGFFLTKIFHPNVSEKGEICVNSLKKDWNPHGWSLYNIFESAPATVEVPHSETRWS